MKNEKVISAKIARLIILLLHNSINEIQAGELNEWMNASEENMDLYEEMTAGVDENVFTAEELVIETENIIDQWVVAGLIIREKQNLISDIEQAWLEEWKNSLPQNQELYRELQHPAYMQKMLVWNALKRAELQLSE